MNVKVARQCRWLSDKFVSVCCNDKSDYCADFVDDDICFTCKYREYTLGIDGIDIAEIKNNE